MINILERISIGLCILVVLIVGFFYAMGGTPSSMPKEFVESVVSNDISQLSASAIKRPSYAPVIKAMKAEDKTKVAENLSKQTGKRAPRKIVQTANVIRPSTLEFVESEANWAPELKQYKSSIIRTKEGDTRLKVTQITENTLLHKIGLRDGDIIELIDGEIMEFSETSTSKYRDMFKERIAKIRAGGSVSITVTRKGGGPETLFFSMRR